MQSTSSCRKTPFLTTLSRRALLICGRSTRLCGLPPTRPRQTSDPVFPRETPTARFIFPSHLWHSIERQTLMLQAGRFFPSGHRDVPVRSTIIARSASGVFSETDRSVERDCVFDAHFPRFSRKDHHRPTSSHSIAFKNPTIPTLERGDFVTRCGSAPTAAVATDTARCKGPYSQPIDCFAVFPRGSGLGLGSQRT